MEGQILVGNKPEGQDNRSRAQRDVTRAQSARALNGGSGNFSKTAGK